VTSLSIAENLPESAFQETHDVWSRNGLAHTPPPPPPLRPMITQVSPRFTANCSRDRALGLVRTLAHRREYLEVDDALIFAHERSASRIRPLPRSRRRIHIPEQSQSAIKSFSSPPRQNFPRACDSFGHFSHAAFDPERSFRRGARLPSSAERFWPPAECGNDTWRIAFCARSLENPALPA